ncbi:hypothetical protein ABIE26_001202 [Pedobacter africanus]|uniref:Uncharacterized protein n=1 Tax=Pedobacter africanus TaxID=151894 RepID=A0ACC6KT38_9SPHI|nr:hypothetical protein [Pedobacter africanus]MDR6782309.1 hypothetical protein [Pedobacter africanus]
MKNLLVITLCFLSIAFIAKAQTKKPVKKTTTTTKTTPAKTTATTRTTTTKPVATDEETGVKAAKQTKTNAGNTSGYKAAIGLKFIYGVALTGKVFISKKSALEGILKYNGAGGLGSNIAFSGLYEYHAPIKGVDGLRWYLGGGGHVNYFSWKDSDVDAVTSFGVAGIVGLEYKFANLPLAVSADWQPGFMISPSSGFSAENGGIGIKYTF